jgi:hypothetical protein
MYINSYTRAFALAALTVFLACDDAEFDNLEPAEVVRDGEITAEIAEQFADDEPLATLDPPVDTDQQIPAASCRTGFRQAGARLCISTNTQNAAPYRTATVRCRDRFARVCTYEDLTYLYYRTTLDASYSPNGRWIGNMVADDNVLCGNRSIPSNDHPNIANFEGTCNKADSRAYWCCHDDSAN